MADDVKWIPVLNVVYVNFNFYSDFHVCIGTTKRWKYIIQGINKISVPREQTYSLGEIGLLSENWIPVDFLGDII